MTAAPTFSGKSALVTGGTSGLGRAIAVALRHAGCQVVCTGVSDTETANFRQSHPQLGCVTVDVTQAGQIQAAVGELSRLDVLVNCAGTILRDNREFEAADFAQVVDVNLTGTLRVCRECHSRLARSGGSVVNLASMLSYFGSGSVPAYSASKGGIAQLTKSLAIAWAPDSIRVNAVAPGWIRTALTQPLFDNPDRRQQILDRTPLGRWGEPEDVCGAVLFLCSDAARFITGVVLPVDGGYSAA